MILKLSTVSHYLCVINSFYYFHFQAIIIKVQFLYDNSQILVRAFEADTHILLGFLQMHILPFKKSCNYQ